MKKFLLSLILSFVFLSGHARKIYSDYFVYTVTDEYRGTCEITRCYDGRLDYEIASKPLYLPETIEDEYGETLKVTGIGEKGLEYCPFYTVIIPDSYTIGKEAFSEARTTSVTLPSKLKSIPEGCFHFSMICNIAIPESVEIIEAEAFIGCHFLDAINIGCSVKEIGDCAFADCMFTSVEIGKNVTVIGNGAFGGCKLLENVVIGSSVKTIGDGAFSSTPITSVTLPESLEYIGEGAFLQCEKLTSIHIPNSVQRIGARAFDSSALSSVTLPEGLEVIEEFTFYGCRNLTEVRIPQKVKRIEHFAFGYCDHLENLSLPSSLRYIGDNAFFNNYVMKELRIPEGVTELDEFAFADFSELEKIYVPASLEKIGSGVWHACNKILEVYYPAKVPIGEYTYPYRILPERNWSCFGYASNLNEVPDPNRVLYVPEEAVELARYTYPWSEFGGATPGRIEAYEFSGVETRQEGNFSGSAEYYNLSGVKVSDNRDSLTPGIYIERRNGINRKVAISR